jgi:hypothetical protein
MFQRCASMPSRRNWLKLVTLQMSAATPKSRSSIAAPAITSRRMVPLPRSCTLGAFFFASPSRSKYMPLSMPFSAPSGIPGCS